MFKQKIFLSSAISLCLSAAFFYAFPAFSKVSDVLDFEIAQGDGDPSENAAPDLLNDEKDETADDAVATITAEGDFLLPTYLLPVESDVKTDPEGQKPEMIEVDTTQTNTQDIPGLMAEQAANDAVPSDEGMDAPTNSNTPAVTEDINIDIDTNVMQQAAEPVRPRQIGTGHANRTATQTAGGKPILIPLTPLQEQPEQEPMPKERVRHVVPSEYADNMLGALEKNTRPGFIMPQEIKVSFYKDATDFSGQTLKWIKAFSMNALADPRLIIQIRLSTQNPGIQQKRLIVLENTLKGNGLSPHQLQIVYTDRSADSLVLRTMVKPENMEVRVKKSSMGKNIEKRTTKW